MTRGDYMFFNGYKLGDIVEINGKDGYIDKEGVIVIEPQDGYIGEFKQMK